LSEPAESPILSYGEAVRFLGVSKAFFNEIKRLIPHRQIGRRYFFHRDALIAWVNGRDTSVDAK